MFYNVANKRLHQSTHLVASNGAPPAPAPGPAQPRGLPQGPLHHLRPAEDGGPFRSMLGTSAPSHVINGHLHGLPQVNKNKENLFHVPNVQVLFVLPHWSG